MKLEVGKEYVVAIPSRYGPTNMIGRCISTDRIRNGEPSALLLCKEKNGQDERVTSVALNGQVLVASRYSPWVVKEYVPKIKVRVIAYQNNDSKKSYSVSYLTHETGFAHPNKGSHLSVLGYLTILSDTIVEMEPSA